LQQRKIKKETLTEEYIGKTTTTKQTKTIILNKMVTDTI